MKKKRKIRGELPPPTKRVVLTTLRRALQESLPKDLAERVIEVSGGHTGVLWMVKHLAHVMNPVKFRAFCKVVPGRGVQLARAFDIWCAITGSGDPVIGWQKFANEILLMAAHEGAFALSGCRLDPVRHKDERKRRWLKAHTPRAAGHYRPDEIFDLVTMLQAHEGEPKALKQVGYKFCLSCRSVDWCPNHFAPSKRNPPAPPRIRIAISEEEESGKRKLPVVA